ncbi:disease resistance protein RPP8-like [Prunus yedoensis var. nudiflora]|uniref:Disease resistance protein RPP8-like n=1 Tax=Prunus yedoensis var. nudiflora TaxID=2094558 RepID=A0A314XVA9_PRUYE|nr:disease resistance protein RPP8-like [Prunus yedoensis var. nudiflora]
MQIVSSCRHIYKLAFEGPIAELPKELHNYPNLTKLQLNLVWSQGGQNGNTREAAKPNNSAPLT